MRKGLPEPCQMQKAYSQKDLESHKETTAVCEACSGLYRSVFGTGRCISETKTDGAA